MRFTLLNDIVPFYTPVEHIFMNRGVPANEIHHYTNVSKEDTYSPLRLYGMKRGAELLVKHVKALNKTGILVDCDADGFTSSALLTNYLEKMFPYWSNSCLIHFFHSDKQHGLSDSVDAILESGVKLVIVPDAGGGDIEHVLKLRENDVEVLVIDHHDSERETYGPCVVINNQHGDYPNPTLSGVGVVYKFCEYIDSLLGVEVAPDFLDLVAVGCVADLMPLTNYETLYYIREGLERVNNPFIRTMIKEQEFSINKHGNYDPFCIGFYVAPFINATIRVGTMDEKLMLFESLLDSRGYTLVDSGKRGHKGEKVPLAEETCRICANVKSRQTKLRDDNLLVIEKLIEERNLLDNKIVAVQLQKELGMDKNILGLIANILMDKYQRPILLLNETEEEINGEKIPVWAGSARNYKYNEIIDLRMFLSILPEVLYAQGHASAFGIAIPKDKFDAFIEHTNQVLLDMDFSPVYRVDYIFDENCDAKDFLRINDLKCYYGTGFEEPYIAITDVHVGANNLQLMSKDKNPTLKITLPNGAEVMKFKSSQEEYDALLGTVIDVVGKCSANTWMGRTTPQILAEEYNVKRMDF